MLKRTLMMNTRSFKEQQTSGAEEEDRAEEEEEEEGINEIIVSD